MKMDIAKPIRRGSRAARCGAKRRLRAGFEFAHAFCSSPGCADGEVPTNIVSGLDGNLYGTTSNGGGCSTCGVVFRFSPASGTYTVLHSVARGESSPGGLNPANDGNFYSTCTSPQGGPPSICRDARLRDRSTCSTARKDMRAPAARHRGSRSRSLPHRKDRISAVAGKATGGRTYGKPRRATAVAL
jgi:uncharacterized repeat protein (TIGR03803 family)